MFKKLCFLMCFVLVLALSGAAGAVPLDFNNPSFELRPNGSQACKSGGSILYLMAWKQQHDGAPWAGRRVRCDVPGGACGKCGDVAEPVPDGYVIAYSQAGNYVYQTISDVFFEAGRLYTLGIEALNWSGHGVTVSLFYGNNPDANEVASRTVYLDSESDSPSSWTYEHVELVSDVEAGAPCIGETIGIKIAGAGGGVGTDDYIYFDMVTLDKAWATTAWGPDPEDGSDEVDRDPVLQWVPGQWVADTNGHQVYFGTSFTEVNDANTTTSGIYRGPVDSNQYDPPETLELVKTYYWRVDEVNDAYVGSDPPAGPWKGDVWSFEVEGRAKEPYPANEAAGVAVDVVLHWTPSRHAVTHNVYFGTDEAAVSSATTLSAEFMVNQGPNTFDTNNYDANGLEFAGEYFWRIDEVNASTAKGHTWSFVVALYSVVEDFDEYVTTPDLRTVWDDYTVNPDSGAEIGIQKLEEFVRDGNSLEYNYDNSVKTGGQYLGSWIDADIADLEIGPDWTKSGIRGLVLYSLGQGGNAGGVNNRMWVELEDTSSNAAVGIYDGNPNDVAIPEWHEWNIDLSVFDACGVSLANIDKIHLGFGGPQGKPAGAKNPDQGGTGTVWFDDIQVHPQRCVPAYSWTKGDFEAEDCFIGTLDVKALSRDWLESGGMVSASPPDANLLLGWYELEEGTLQTAGNSGTLSSTHNGTLGNTPGVDACDPTWITTDPCAARERCLEFDGLSEYVLIPGFNVTSNTATYTAWVKRSGDQSVFTPVFCSLDGNDPDPNDLSQIKLAGLFFGSSGPDTNPSWQANNELCYYWRDDSWDFHTGMIVPELWTFIAVTIAPDEAVVYMYDGTMSSVANPAPHGIRLFDGVNRIGGWVNQNNKVKFVNGRIDDARFYNYTLSQGEVLYLADPTGEFYRPLEDWRTDIDNDDTVNFVDHAYMADNWLKEILWPEP